MSEDSKAAALSKPMAIDSICANHRTDAAYASGEMRTRWFHDAMELPNRHDWDYIPSVSERVLRGKLLIEEVLETLAAMGLTLSIDGVPANKGFEEITVEHIEGSRYDPIETADGLGDIKVIVNGTAAVFGIPMTQVDLEIWASNMTKLDENGKPIVNQCNTGYCETRIGGYDCDNPFHLIDSKQPVGKILKPKTYVPANIARLFYESTEG